VTVDARPRHAPATYRVSALASGLRTMWRSSGAALPAILVNAVVQAALMYWDVLSGLTAQFLVSSAISAASALVLYAVLSAAALEAVDGSGGARPVVARARRHLPWFAVWVAAQWAVIGAVSVVHVALILLVAAITAFLPLAAMDGRGAASLRVDLRVLVASLGRWLVTTVVLLVAGVVLWLGSALTTLFVKGTPAAAIFWLALGVLTWWVLTAWALVYRRSAPGAG